MTPKDKIHSVTRRDSKEKTDILIRNDSSFRLNDVNLNDYKDLKEENEKLKKQVAKQSKRLNELNDADY